MKGTNANSPRGAVDAHGVEEYCRSCNMACPTLLTTPANSLLLTLDVPSLHSNIPKMKILMVASIYYVLPLIIPFLLAHSVTTFA